MTHTFERGGNEIQVTLPKLSALSDEFRSHGMASVGSSRAADGAVLDYEIHRVDVRTDASMSILVDPETFNRAPKAYELYTQQEQDEFENICDRHLDIAKTSFEYWLSVLRWKLEDHRIGRVQIVGAESGWSTYLEDVENSHDLWAARLMYSVPGYRVVKRHEWAEIEHSLQLKESPPTHIGLQHDAQENISHRDYRSALIELAMCCEIFLRSMVLKRLPKSFPENLVGAIEELNINQYVTKHFRNLVIEKDRDEYKKLSNELSSLFDKRNKLLHMGNSEGATREQCERFIRTAKQLLAFERKLQCME